ncbi:MAG: acyl-CoA dehydrogenase [Firmicutes bacterium]|nr:acyl-CoA dehydrogenase [Bacillota bacterium]
MDFNLNEDQLMIQEMVHKFAEKELAPRAAHYDKTMEFPWENVKKLAGLNLMGITVPPEYGGAGLDSLSYCIAIEEISRACASTGVITAVQNSLAEFPLYKFGNEDHKKKYLPLLASGEKIGAYALTEPNSGSDAAGMETTAVAHEDHYILNGVKTFITNSIAAEIFLLYATVNKSLGHKGICCFIIEKNFPGFKVGKKEEMMGVRASGTCQLILENCRVPKENILGAEGDGFKIAMTTLDVGRMGIAAQAVGIAQACMDQSIKYAKERKQFNQPISSFQLVQAMLVEMAVKIDAARLLLYRAAKLRDEGAKFVKESSMAKWFSSETAMECAIKAVQIHGGYGYTTEYPVERLMRDAKVTQIYEGTSEIQKLVIARNLLG